MRKIPTVAELAKAAQLEDEDALVMLWDLGLERYNAPSDRIRRCDVDLAKHALNIPSKGQLTDPAYWVVRLGLADREALRSLLDELGTPMRVAARKLPKGGVAKLRRHAALLVDDVEANERQEDVEAAEMPVAWRIIGRPRTLRLLTVDEVEQIHWELVKDFANADDPIDPPGVRSEHLLESAVYRQHTAMAGDMKYPTVELAAAALFHAIVHDHPFFNGNKRTALVAMLVLLDENGVATTCDEQELFRLVLRLAQHKLVDRTSDATDAEMLHIAQWLDGCTRNIEKRELPVQWRRLRQILNTYGCEVESPSGVGNRLNIRRNVEVRGMFGRKRTRLLKTQVRHADDGRQADVGTIKAIRRSLALDEENGIDSFDFYQRGVPSSSAFIVRYRRTLKRLARL